MIDRPLDQDLWVLEQCLRTGASTAVLGWLSRGNEPSRVTAPSCSGSGE
jgi:hypothetical protein